MVMAFNGRPVPFTMTNREVAGSLKTILLYECAKCAVSDFVTVKTGAPLQIENSNNTMRYRGWAIHRSKKSKVYCPTCKDAASENDVDSELKKVLTIVVPILAPPEQQETSVASASTAAVSPIRPMTGDMRLAIRNALDLHFDDKKGQYLEGMSDDKIAVQLGIPRIHVETIREAAWGPIKIDPEVSAIMKEISELSRLSAEYSAAQANMTKAVDDFNTRLAHLNARVDRHISRD